LKLFIDSKYVSEEHREKLIALACKIWAFKPKSVIIALSAAFVNLSEEQFANLAKDMDFENEEFRGSLSSAWGYKEYSLSYHLGSLTHLLNETLKKLSDTDKFGVLLCWFEYCQLDKINFYQSVIKLPEITAESKVLIFNAYKELNLISDLAILNCTIEECIELQSENSFSSKIFESKEVLSLLLDNSEKRYAFTRTMLSRFDSIASLMYRKHAASWGKELIGNDALKFITSEDIDNEDMEYLEVIFKSASRIKTLKKHLRNREI